MNNDEMQVLGKRREINKREFVTIVLVSLLVLAALVWCGMMLHQHYGTEELKERKPIGSTIVPELQQTVDSILTAEMEMIYAEQGQVIVMEVQTGKILAMVGKERRFDGRYTSCENFAYQQEPGATMMAAALLALLETGEVELTDVVEGEDGIWNADGYDMKDHNWRRGGYGKMTLERALEVSSNIGISKMIRKVFRGKELRYFELLDKMSFGRPYAIEGITGLSPMVSCSPKDSTWASYQLLWNSIGYERKMAPIQMLTFYNAIANNGCMVKPTLRDEEKTMVINQQIASKKSIMDLQIALEHVVSQGLGRKAGTPILRVAGKTGTAQATSRYEDEDITEYHVSFCGYFPADAPKYSIIVSMNKLGLPASGGGMAGHVFHDIVEWMLCHDMPTILVYDEETGDTLKLKETDSDGTLTSFKASEQPKDADV